MNRMPVTPVPFVTVLRVLWSYAPVVAPLVPLGLTLVTLLGPSVTRLVGSFVTFSPRTLVPRGLRRRKE